MTAPLFSKFSRRGHRFHQQTKKRDMDEDKIVNIGHKRYKKPLVIA